MLTFSPKGSTVKLLLPALAKFFEVVIATYIENRLFKIKSPHALEVGMVQTSVISLALEIEIVRNAVKLEKLYSN